MMEDDSVGSLQRRKRLPQWSARDEVAIAEVRNGVDHYDLEVAI